ncbi:MAG: hypothetical protein ACRDH6_06335 [Actinomycetota bacterium]
MRQRKSALVLLLLLVLLVLVIPAAAFAATPSRGEAEAPPQNAAVCTERLVNNAQNPPSETHFVICRGEFCQDEIGVAPSKIGPFIGYYVGEVVDWVNCVR